MQSRYDKKRLSRVEVGLGLAMLSLVAGAGLGYGAMILGYVSLSSLGLGSGESMAEVSTEIGDALDCVKTLEPHLDSSGMATCAGLVDVVSRDGMTLVSKGEGLKRGPWTLRAVCDASGLAVQASTLLPDRPLTSIDPRDFAPLVGLETSGVWRDILPRSMTCRQYFQSKSGTSTLAAHGSFLAADREHTETVRLSFRPQGATCTAGTQAAGCICGRDVDLGPTWVRFKARSGGRKAPPCFINYMILGD